MAHSIILDDQVWCARCENYTKFASIRHASECADVSSRTIYRYIDADKIAFYRLTGDGSYRVCTGCLFGLSKRPEE